MIANELAVHLEATLKKLSSMGVQVKEQKELPYGVQLSLCGYGAVCRINIYYSRKKGISTVQSGGDRSFLRMVMQKIDGASASSAGVPDGLRAGSDEAGKGEYFGPLVAAAVVCEKPAAEAMLAMGVGDSKKLSASKIRELYEKITVMENVSYAVCSVSPREYNRLFDAFRQQGKNSLDILAMAHGKAFAELYSRGFEPEIAVVDKFCEMHRLRPWLPAFSTKMELRVRAEDSEPSVAAASIIARSVYIDQLSAISSSCGVVLAPGAGAGIDKLGKELVQAKGDAILRVTAKVHFANTLRIT